MAILTEDQKAKKSEANKAYRARKKEEALKNNWEALSKFEMSFPYKIRLFKNLKLEKTNSYCASPGTVLKFEKIFDDDNNNIVYRVRKSGRRTFFTTNNELKPPVEA